MLKVVRFGPFVVIFLGIVLLIFSARASCSNKQFIPYLGKWTGGFKVQTLPAVRATPQALQQSSLFGYVMVYAMARSFKMHLEGAQEVIDVDGNWTLHGHRLTLTSTGVKIDDEGGAAVRNPNLPFTPSEAVRAAYAHPFVLDLSSDHRRLTGLPVSMGSMIGRHEFARD